MTTDEAVDVATGAEFAVVLALAGGTGYRWELTRVPDGVELVREEAPLPSGPAHDGGGTPSRPASPPIPGGQTQQRFLLRATGSPGERIAVGFVLRRPWEANPVDRRTVVVTIHRPRGQTQGPDRGR